MRIRVIEDKIMTQEERITICKILRKETCCGMMDASNALNTIIEALKAKPVVILDNPRRLHITYNWI
jgi:hypothetical protein